jgi:hypothetical protein
MALRDLNYGGLCSARFAAEAIGQHQVSPNQLNVLENKVCAQTNKKLSTS